MMKGKFLKFYLLFAAGIISAASVWLFLVYILIGSPAWSDKSMHECLEKKYELARAMTGSKIIVAGGSGAFFSVDCGMIQRELGMPAINAALHAGLGAEYILHIAKTAARPGDIVVLPLEYELYQAKLDYVYIGYVLSYDLNYFYAKSFFEKARMIMGVSNSQLLLGLYWLALSSAPPLSQPESETEKGGGYFDNITENGDCMVNDGVKMRDAYTSSNMLLSANSVNPKALDLLSGFIDWCKANNVRFVAALPALLYDDAYQSERVRENIDRIIAFYKSKGVPLIGGFEENMYSPEDMYDSIYHLNKVGREKRTKRMINDLRPFITAAGP
ncbi:hypothetical protein FACS1894167_11330 [Synergistales bacterium]|nr:hypothetical protein FACS1894167_11330 [Synergistales bacterium]